MRRERKAVEEEDGREEEERCEGTLDEVTEEELSLIHI